MKNVNYRSFRTSEAEGKEVSAKKIVAQKRFDELRKRRLLETQRERLLNNNSVSTASSEMTDGLETVDDTKLLSLKECNKTVD